MDLGDRGVDVTIRETGEPDVAVGIVAADVVLLIEVADTSYRYDRHVKLPLYARSGVHEVWIVDLTRDVLEVFRDPSATGYGEEQRLERGGTVAPDAFPDVALAVNDFVPAA